MLKSFFIGFSFEVFQIVVLFILYEPYSISLNSKYVKEECEYI